MAEKAADLKEFAREAPGALGADLRFEAAGQADRAAGAAAAISALS